MAPWEDAWLNGKLMPPYELPNLLLIEAQAIAEECLFEADFRSILEEWVPRPKAEEAITEILWTGCRLHGQLKQRVAPIPVMVKLMYTDPYPENIVELEDRIRADIYRAIREWLRAYRKYGSKFGGAP